MEVGVSCGSECGLRLEVPSGDQQGPLLISVSGVWWPRGFTGTIQTLTEGLRDYTGAIVAITHNREFARLLEPTHIVSVVDGVVTKKPCLGPEQLTEEAFETGKTGGAGGLEEVAAAAKADAKAVTGELSYEDRKRIQRSKSRLDKVVSLVEKKEAKCEVLDSEMFEVGNDTAKLAELQTKKSNLESEIEELMTEWEELEQLLDETAHLL
jgi:hypothetical protein